MSLQEFVGQNNKFAKDTFDDMQSIKKVWDEAKKPEQRRKDLYSLYNSYYILWGYIEAAYEYKHISFEERMSLEDELFIVLTGQEG